MNYLFKACLAFLVLGVVASSVIYYVYLNKFYVIERNVPGVFKSNGHKITVLENRYRKEMVIDDGECSCKKDADADRIYVRDKLELGERGSLDRDAWTKEQELVVHEPIVLCQSLLPLEYVGGGITVEPKQYVRLVGLSAHESLISSSPNGENHTGEVVITFTSLTELGNIFIETPENYTEFVTVENNLKKSATMRMKSDLSLVNIMLKNVQYYTTYYDINHRDTVEITVLDHVLHVHVHIRRRQPPRLYDPGADNHLSWKVTILMAIDNYKNVGKLIESVRKFYHNTTIVVADYSLPNEMKKLNLSDVKQYFLPEKHNKFAAMSLAISQVRTKYFLYLNDEGIFTHRTKLELFVEKLENVNESLDVVGGFFDNEKGEIVDRDRLYMRLEGESGGDHGDCMHLKYGSYRMLDSFPQCAVVDAVGDFFMAKTLPWWNISFDPDVCSFGLTAVFMEAIGMVRVALCTDVTLLNTVRYNPGEDNAGIRASANDLMVKTNHKCFSL